MSNKTKAALQGRQCQNSNQIHSQLITQIDHVKQCSTVTGFPVSLRLAGGCLSYISGDTTSPKFLGGVFPVVCNAGILTAPLAQFIKAGCSLNQRRNSALDDIENYHLQNILHLLTQIFGAVGSIPRSKPVQPFGSMPCLNSSLRANAFNQLPRLTPSRLAASFNCWRNSGVIRIWKVGDRPSPFGVLSLLIVDMYVRNPLVWILLCTYVITAYVKKATPQSVTSTTRASDQTVNEVTIMACFKSTQTHPKFQYRFLALNRHDKKAKPCRLSVEATTEHEARRILAPHFILSFAARLPVQEVRHV
ncbi:MAG: host cell division inhibitor Icd-like protein [Acinetobacter sp.]